MLAGLRYFDVMHAEILLVWNPGELRVIAADVAIAEPLEGAL